MLNIGSVIAGTALSALIFYTGVSIPLEVSLPFLHLYHILTFTMTYPEATKTRRFLATICLSFADIFITLLIFQKQLPEKLWIWISEFIVVYIMISNLTFNEINQGMAGKPLRSVIYAGSGYVKAMSLVSSLMYLSSTYPPHDPINFLYNVSVGLAKLGSTVAIYYIDRIIWGETFFHVNTLNEIYKRIKHYLIPICLVIETCALIPQAGNFLYESSKSYHQLVACSYMIAWYLNESHEYGLKFRQR